MTATIVWLRQDLRLADNPALAQAARRGGPVIPLYVWAPEEEGEWPPGAASRWWLHRSLESLAADLAQRGSRLVLRRGSSLTALREVINTSGADAVYWNRRYEPASLTRDTDIQSALRQAGVEAESFNAALLREPRAMRTKSGTPFQVFTPFWKACLAQPDPPAPLRVPRTLPAPPRWPDSLSIADLGLEPRLNWASGFVWTPGARGAVRQLGRFLRGQLDKYPEQRNRPDMAGTSRLSPHLHYGELSPRQVWHGVAREAARRRWPRARWRQSQFLAELGWREFSHHLLFHYPRSTVEPLREEFSRFPWITDRGLYRAWCRGRTGYPIVDAGMRELWATGWMHNRVRMIVASFLTKDLRIHWLEGARWFWDTLVDADLAQNTLGWQWTAGSGADAAPYFRVFNPVAQGLRYDPEGVYVRRWVPELAGLPQEWIHRPMEAPPAVLAAAGVELGGNYPPPLIDHALARQEALAAYRAARGGRT